METKSASLWTPSQSQDIGRKTSFWLKGERRGWGHGHRVLDSVSMDGIQEFALLTNNFPGCIDAADPGAL